MSKGANCRFRTFSPPSSYVSIECVEARTRQCISHAFFPPILPLHAFLMNDWHPGPSSISAYRNPDLYPTPPYQAPSTVDGMAVVDRRNSPNTPPRTRSPPLIAWTIKRSWPVAVVGRARSSDGAVGRASSHFVINQRLMCMKSDCGSALCTLVDRQQMTAALANCRAKGEEGGREEGRKA